MKEQACEDEAITSRRRDIEVQRDITCDSDKSSKAAPAVQPRQKVPGSGGYATVLDFSADNIKQNKTQHAYTTQHIMPPTTIRSSPSTADFVPLAEWQAQTPETFHGGKPVLYYHATGAKAYVPKSQSKSLPFFPSNASITASDPESSVLENGSEEQVAQTVDLFVNSEYVLFSPNIHMAADEHVLTYYPRTFTIFSPQTETGMTIPYQNITLHAIKHVSSDSEQTYPGVYLQLEFSDGGADDESYDTVELTLIPAQATQEETARFFEAISSCADLNPDAADEDDDEDEYDKIVFEGDMAEGRELDGLPGVYDTGDVALPPPMPGSSGWITAENVHEFFDKDGNWIGGGQDGEEEGVSGELGEGAGRVRGREEVDGEEGVGGEENGESKKARNE